MTVVFKVIMICISGLCFISISKKYFPEYTSVILLSCSVFVILYNIGYFNEFILQIKNMSLHNNNLQKYYKTMLKIVIISLMCEFSSQLCADSGEKSLSDKIYFSGKIIIMSMIVPEILKFFNYMFETMKNL